MFRKLLICSLAALFGLSSGADIERMNSAASTQDRIDQSRTDYEEWVRHYTSQPLTGYLDGAEIRIRLIITAIEGDEETASARDRSIPSILNDRRVSYGCQIYNDGRIHYFQYSSMGAKGSGYPTIPENELERLDQLLAKLPDDGSRLPPAGRRVVVQIPDADHWRGSHSAPTARLR